MSDASTPTNIHVEENRNVVYVDEEQPNRITVEIRSSVSAKASILYSSGPPWLVIEI